MTTLFKKGNSRYAQGSGREAQTRAGNSTAVRWAARLALVAVFIGWMAGPAFGQDNRFYSATVDPTTVAAGEDETFTFTITNCDGSVCSPASQKAQTIKTITVDIPAGFTVNEFSCTIGAADGDEWDLTFLMGQLYIDKEGSTALAVGESLTLTCTATASCEAGFNEWTTAAFNDDVEPPGPGTAPYALVGDQPEVEVTGTCDDGGFEPGDYCSYTQGGWGAPPNGSNPAQKLADNFDFVYPADLFVGTGYEMAFSAASNVQAYLPAGGTAGALTASLVNPTSSSAGVFGGQVTALRINVDLNDAGIIDGFDGTFSVLVLTGTGGSLDGSTVAEILAAAEMALGGGPLPGGYSYSDLNYLVDQLNNAFDNCYPSDWAIAHLVRP